MSWLAVVRSLASGPPNRVAACFKVTGLKAYAVISLPEEPLSIRCRFRLSPWLDFLSNVIELQLICHKVIAVPHSYMKDMHKTPPTPCVPSIPCKMQQPLKFSAILWPIDTLLIGSSRPCFDRYLLGSEIELCPFQGVNDAGKPL